MQSSNYFPHHPSKIPNSQLVVSFEPPCILFMMLMMSMNALRDDSMTGVLSSGINVTQTCLCFVQAGANMIVSGSALVRSTDPRYVMSLMRKAVADAIHKQSHIITAS